MPDPYFELHAASAFSFLRGASLPEQLAEEAARLELPGLAVLDRDGVCGAPRLFSAARARGLRPLVGAELTLEDGSVVPLLVENSRGYQNLCRLISTAKLEPRPAGVPSGERPPGTDAGARKRPCWATWTELAQHAGGLIALTGDEDGPVQRAWQTGGLAAATAALERLKAIFPPGNLFAEVQRQRVRGEETIVRMLAGLAATHHLPLLATGGALHATRAGRDVADVFTCLRHHTTLDTAGRLLAPNAARHLRSGRLMRQLFADLPEAVDNTARVAERLRFTLADLDYQFPDFPVGPGETMAGVLRERTYAGARQRFPAMTEAVTRQLDRELALITKLEFCGYFLIVWDICQWGRERGILMQGRGSAANSAVCFALGITEVDPIKCRLLFERFLSEGRGQAGHKAWPDIDLDLPSGERREAILQEIYARYGRRGAAMVANVITYRGRSTAREVGKVLGLPRDVLDRFSSLYASGDFPHTLGLSRQLAAAGLAPSHPRHAAMISLCQQLASLPRHLGQHSGGMVLCPGRLDQVVPIEPATMPGRSLVQWDKDDCEDLGLVKIDFLGLGMMAVLQDCQRLCGERGRPFALRSVPHDDEPTFALMRQADTVGVFQIESRAQMATLPRLQPREFYDVVIAVSIVRPGPITGGLTSPLLRRRAGVEPPVCLDPSVHALLEPILGRTLGVILFQEQMLGLAMVLAGFSGAEAEELRRAMGFHRTNDRLLKVIGKLHAAVRARGHSETVAKKVVDACASFALYGFPESHAISFALLAYASTWLKLNRAAEFYASLLNHQPMGFYSPATLVQDARRRTPPLKFRPVCVQCSEWDCTVEADDIVRLGLRYVQGLREAHAREIVAARQARRFASLGDFLLRTHGTAAERRALAAVGALNALAGHRRAALWQVEAAWSSAATLFQHAGGLLDETAPDALAPMTLEERVRADFGGTALTVGAHPMGLVRAQLPDLWRASELPLARTGDKVVIGGSVICRQRPGTAKGIVFISLEDETGVANAVVSAEMFERSRRVINEEPTLRITGRLQNRAGVIHVRAERIEHLRAAAVPAQSSHDFR